MKKELVLSDITKIRGYCDGRLSKMRRNFNRYTTNGDRQDELQNPYTKSPISFWYQRGDEDLGPIPSVNLIRSIIDTRVSKISQTKVRPFFNPVNGLYHTRKVCRHAQNFFDEYFEQKKIYPLGVEVLRDSDIFDVGWVWIRDETKTIEKAHPWDVYFDPSELQYGKMTRCFIDLWYYPTIYIKERLKKAAKKSTVAADMLTALEADPSAKNRIVYYYDLEEKKEYLVCGADIIDERPIEYDRCPFIPLWCNKPIKGASSFSTADNVYTMQRQIDMVVERLAAAFELNPGNTIFVPLDATGAALISKPSEYDNSIGNVYGVPQSLQGGNPVTVSTPRPIDQMYINWAQWVIDTTYNMEGISQLSAQGKKPTGITAGVALETLENVESDRHNVVLQSFIAFFMAIAEGMIDIFPAEDSVLPNKIGRGKSVKWSEIKKNREEYSIQFTATSSLSKDPETKMKQVEKMVSMGMIKPDLAAQLMDMPDLERAFSILSSSYDACQRIIEKAIEDEDFNFEEIVNLDQLFQETMQMYLGLYSNDEKQEYLERCKGLLEVIRAKQTAIMQATTPPPPPPVPVQPPAPVPVQITPGPQEMPMQGAGVPAPGPMPEQII
jgi:hypothetical protein